MKFNIKVEIDSDSVNRKNVDKGLFNDISEDIKEWIEAVLWDRGITEENESVLISAEVVDEDSHRDR